MRVLEGFSGDRFVICFDVENRFFFETFSLLLCLGK